MFSKLGWIQLCQSLRAGWRWQTHFTQAVSKRLQGNGFQLLALVRFELSNCLSLVNSISQIFRSHQNGWVRNSWLKKCTQQQKSQTVSWGFLHLGWKSCANRGGFSDLFFLSCSCIQLYTEKQHDLLPSACPFASLTLSSTSGSNRGPKPWGRFSFTWS